MRIASAFISIVREIMSSQPIILFDLDGTLVDTAPDLAATMNALLTRYGRPNLDIPAIRNIVGEGARNLMARAWRETGEPASAELLDELFDAFLDYYLDHLSDFSKPFPGLDGVLARLGNSPARVGICTNKPEHASHALLRELNLAHHFETVIGGDTLATRKPDAAPILECIRRLDGQIANAVLIGDSKTDIHAARAAKIPVVAVSFGYSNEPIMNFEPDFLIDHLDDLTPTLGQIFPDHF